MFRQRDVEHVGVLISGALCWGQTRGKYKYQKLYIVRDNSHLLARVLEPSS